MEHIAPEAARREEPKAKPKNPKNLGAKKQALQRGSGERSETHLLTLLLEKKPTVWNILRIVVGNVVKEADSVEHIEDCRW